MKWITTEDEGTVTRTLSLSLDDLGWFVLIIASGYVVAAVLRSCGA